MVFDNGLGGTMDWWAKVVPVLEADTTVLAYNRSGYGRSSPVDTLRDGEHVVQELRELLRERGLAPPYVLVDSTHPAQMQGQCAPEHWPTWVHDAPLGVPSGGVICITQ
ncbi:alpha/beta hydrolase [Rhodoferax sp.]|uniref:alpha/beta fold hydrolase n=1 Tax=Rhodoferax sp. TaxID=50421 RepID=UPI00260E117A|nr:alpha/beta hydrolase [Rhodoferax sp.]MDD2927026.1 alpha/beta hydrolase [Rhodoferax sp.]